jgi:hypothetical protein
MNEQNRKSKGPPSGIIQPPAYPWDGRQLFGELRRRLSDKQGVPISFQRLGQLIGKTKPTAYHWFDRYNHPHVRALFCCMERLSLAERYAYVEGHCRVFPTLKHPWLAHAPSKTGKLMELLRQQRGLTVIVGRPESSSFLITACGHSCQRSGGHQRIVGVDLHRPYNFVPVESCTYIDGTAAPEHVRRLVLTVWPRIMTSTAALVILNGIWSAIPALREDILRAAGRSNVVVTMEETPDLVELGRQVLTPLHVVTLSASKRIKGGIRLDCRQEKRWKKAEKR